MVHCVRNRGVHVITTREFRQQVAAYVAKGQRKLEIRCRRHCGHDEVVSLRLATGLIELVDLEAQLCPRCRRPDRGDDKAQAERAYGLATRRAVELGLPALTGTEKRVGWANVLRLRAMRVHGDEIKAVVIGQLDSTWWIAHRKQLNTLAPFRQWEGRLR